MSARLLIWGYGRVGSAMMSGLIKQPQSHPEKGVGRNEGESVFEEFLVISNKPRPAHIPDNIQWILPQQILNNPQAFFQLGDVLILTLSDSQIQKIAKQCDVSGLTVVHCSGATPLIELQHAESMVFYPLQTFSGTIEVDWTSIPVFVEFSSVNGQEMANQLARLLQVKQIEEMSFSVRQNLHMAAVFANNFTTAMAGVAHDILREKGLNPQWIQPILAQTAENLGYTNPWQKLTGPAKRGDRGVVEKHLELLKHHPEWKNIYENMSGYIQNHHGDGSDAPIMP